MTKAEQHIGDVVRLMQAVSTDVQSRHLRECAELWKSVGSEKFQIIMKERVEAQRRQQAEDFAKYTTKPCGCHQDPGGHP